ncbi:hypothetical protein HZC34_01890 [Candidatus Saganbacteria bacterium]|nr:hypothetical protein [Candidatus Saganbacteria bacterium]
MLNKLKLKIQNLEQEIQKLEHESKDISTLYKKRKDEVNNLVTSLDKYKKDKPKIAGQMEYLIKAKAQDFNKLKRDMATLNNKQKAVREEIKIIFSQINSFVKYKNNKRTILEKVAENAKNIANIIEAKKPIIAKEQPIPIEASAKNSMPIAKEEIKAERKQEVLAAKAPVKKPKADDFHSKAAKEASDQAKYLKSLFSKTRHYGNA